MYKKIISLITIVLIFVLVPLKIFSQFNTIAFVESGWFTAIFLAMILGILLANKYNKVPLKIPNIKKNIFLAITSLLVSVSFFWCIFTYYNDQTIYDFEWQPIIMATFSILSCLAFILFSYVFFTGKNILFKLPLFLFCPVFWFSFDMILFLSIQNDNSDVYDITFTALLALFFLYYTQVFSTSSKLNISKLLMAFGVPAIGLMFIKCVPVFINYLNNPESVKMLDLSTCLLETTISIYVIFVIIDLYEQISDASKKLNKTIVNKI